VTPSAASATVPDETVAFCIPARSGSDATIRAGPEIMTNLFAMDSLSSALPIVFVVVLLAILVISFRSRAVVFCQYLEAMTGIQLKPAEVRRLFRERGRNGVREMFLDLIIREDLKEGPIEIPEDQRVG
jgi:hypothetical protein